MSFIETRFLDQFIGLGSAAGPEYRTDITELLSGRESRNQVWATPRHQYSVRISAKTSAKIDALRDLYHSTRGRLNGFRFKDFNDYTSAANMEDAIAFTDQSLGAGNGVALTYQLAKNYTSGTETLTRSIKKPVSGTTILGFTDSLTVPTWSTQDASSRWSINTTTGLVTFSANVAPTITIAATYSGTFTRIQTSPAHGLVTGDTVFLSAFTGDWAGLNGRRFSITKIDVVQYYVNFNSSAYAAYSGNGGVMGTIPQTGEYVVAGYQYDVPVRFNSDSISIDQISPGYEEATINLIEIK